MRLALLEFSNFFVLFSLRVKFPRDSQAHLLRSKSSRWWYVLDHSLESHFIRCFQGLVRSNFSEELGCVFLVFWLWKVDFILSQIELDVVPDLCRSLTCLWDAWL